MSKANTFDRLPKVSYLCVVASFLALVGCGGGGGSSSQPPPPPPPEVDNISVNPGTAQLFTGKSQLFTAQVMGTGAFNANVTWSVNSVVGGNSTYGTIASGQYTAPATPPNPSSVTITATSVQDPAVYGTSMATVYASAVLTSISPSAASAGEQVTINGQNCVRPYSGYFLCREWHEYCHASPAGFV